MIERFRGAGFGLTLFLATFLAPMSARPQGSDELSALNKQVQQLFEQRNYTEATTVALRAAAAAERLLGPDDAKLGVPLHNLAFLYQYQGRYDQAEPLYQRALAISEKAPGSDQLEVAANREVLARLYRIQRRYAEAEQLLRRALATREKVQGSENVDLCHILGHLAVLYETQARYADAEPYRERCRSIREKALSSDDPAVGQSLHELARLYRKQGRAEATPVYNRAIVIFGPNHPEAIVAAIGAGEYRKAARALGLGGGESENSEAVTQQVRRTFFGQVTDLRWTDYGSNVARGLKCPGPCLQTITVSLASAFMRRIRSGTCARH
jgi:tetratricopeptide (TPR) repeat protein